MMRWIGQYYLLTSNDFSEKKLQPKWNRATYKTNSKQIIAASPLYALRWVSEGPFFVIIFCFSCFFSSWQHDNQTVYLVASGTGGCEADAAFCCVSEGACAALLEDKPNRQLFSTQTWTMTWQPSIKVSFRWDFSALTDMMRWIRQLLFANFYFQMIFLRYSYSLTVSK